MQFPESGKDPTKEVKKDQHKMKNEKKYIQEPVKKRFGFGQHSTIKENKMSELYKLLSAF